MILQALNSYYQRLIDDPQEDVALLGFSEAKISFALVLDQGGRLVEVQDLREQKGKKPQARILRVPQAVTRTVGVAANFLWDNTSYVLGADSKANPERTLQCFEAFKEMTRNLAGQLDAPDLKAVMAFLDSWQPEKAVDLPLWEEMAGLNLVFRLDGQRRYVHDSPQARQVWLEHYRQSEAGEEGQCLVSGEQGTLARLHPPIKGVLGAQSSGARLVSFNLDAFTSYGKEQNFNAPVGIQAAFAYTTVLNRLLAQGSRQRIQIGDATVVFWSEGQSEAEVLLGMAISGGEAEDNELNMRLREFLKAAKQGVPFPGLDPESPFYILGLSPNASRLAVRFWHPSTVGQMQQRLGEHLNDLEMVRLSDKQPEHLPLWMLLKETAAQGKNENVPPQLAGELTRAMLTGRPYPRTLLSALTTRIRADKNLGYLRAALIKAYLGRLWRHSETHRNQPQSMEVTVSLDPDNTNTAYRMGRLFAVLENLQRKAIPGLNTTIRDKYLSSASSTPRVSFPYLISNAQKHYNTLRKKEGKGGLADFFDTSIGKILDGLEASSGFPTTLSLEEQGQFFLGYYHQKAHRPAKKETETSPDQTGESKED